MVYYFTIDEIKIVWPATGITQLYKNVKPNQVLKITEGKQETETIPLKPITFKMQQHSMPGIPGMKMN